MVYNMENLIELLKERGGIFNVKFIKADGSKRSMNARFGVKKNLKGVGLKYNPEARGNIVVFSMNDKGYRTVRLDNVISIKFNGLTYLNKIDNGV